MPVSAADQDCPDAHKRVRTIVTVVSRCPAKRVAKMTWKHVQMEMAKVIERAIVLQQGNAVAAQSFLELLRHDLCCSGDLGEQVIGEIREVSQMRARADQDVARVDGRMVEEADDAVVLVNDVGWGLALGYGAGYAGVGHLRGSGWGWLAVAAGRARLYGNPGWPRRKGWRLV